MKDGYPEEGELREIKEWPTAKGTKERYESNQGARMAGVL